MKKTFLLILAISILLLLPIGVNAMPLCDCNENQDCEPGDFCVEPMGEYNPCEVDMAFEAHCKPCKSEGEKNNISQVLFMNPGKPLSSAAERTS
jgi:hypothetical protein